MLHMNISVIIENFEFEGQLVFFSSEYLLCVTVRFLPLSLIAGEVLSFRLRASVSTYVRMSYTFVWAISRQLLAIYFACAFSVVAWAY